MCLRRNGITSTISGGTQFNQRDIVLVPFVYTDLAGVEQRPALIISGYDYNKGDDVIVCMITSQLKLSKFAVQIAKKDIVGGQLLLDSMVKPGRLLTIKKTVVIKKFGTLNETKSKEVIDKVKEIIELRRKPDTTMQLPLP